MRTLSMKKPQAQKEHVCEWCGTKIPEGEEHRKWAGLSGSYFHSWRMHEDCYQAYIRTRIETGEIDFDSYMRDRGKTLTEMENE